MSDGLRAFMREGMDRFPDAYEAVKLFDTNMRQQFEAALAVKEDWDDLTDIEALRTGYDAGTTKGSWYYGLFKAKLHGKPVRIEYGIWWSPPQSGLKRIAYANFNAGGDDLLAPSYRPSQERVRCGTLDKRPRVYLEPDPEAVTDDLRTLLTELLKGASETLAQR